MVVFCCRTVEIKCIAPLIYNDLLLIYAANPFTNLSISSLLLGQLGRPECACVCEREGGVYSAWGSTVEIDGHMAGRTQPLRGGERLDWMVDGQTGDDSAGRRASLIHSRNTGRRTKV